MTPQWVQLVIGTWVLVSPWILGFSGISIMKWSNVLAGVALVLLGAWRIFGTGSAESEGNSAADKP